LIVELLAGPGKILSRVTGKLQFDFLAKYTVIRAVLSSVRAEREDSGSSFQRHSSENLISRSSCTEKVDEYAPFRVPSLIREACQHFTAAKTLYHLLDNSLVREGLDP